MYNEYSQRFGAKIAMIICAHYLDVPFYNSLFDSINTNNTNFSVGMYLRQVGNNKQYQMKTFQTTLVDGELNKSDKEILDEKEVKWSKSELQNKTDVVQTVGYDPFENHPEEDRRFLFSELVKYFDDDISDDTYKLSQIVQIVNNNNQIRNYDVLISKLDPIKNSNDIKSLNTMKSNLVQSNDKMAKENEISVKNRSNKEVGKSTLTFLMKDLREKGFKVAEANYYDQLKSEGTLWAMEMSMRAIQQNGFFDENDMRDIKDIQRKLVIDLQNKVDGLLEEKRLLQIKIQQLEAGGHND